MFSQNLIRIKGLRVQPFTPPRPVLYSRFFTPVYQFFLSKYGGRVAFSCPGVSMPTARFWEYREDIDASERHSGSLPSLRWCCEEFSRAPINEARSILWDTVLARVGSLAVSKGLFESSCFFPQFGVCYCCVSVGYDHLAAEGPSETCRIWVQSSLESFL